MPPEQKLPTDPPILTTTVGSYAQIAWLQNASSEQAVKDATEVVIQTQRRLGIDLPTDGELYRFDPNHPDTNGMIEYFISRIGGIDTRVGLGDSRTFREKHEMAFRRKPAGVVREALSEGSLDLVEACAQAVSLAQGPLKFTLTSPYMLARTLLDCHYKDLEGLVMALADQLAAQVPELPSACVQVDEANVPGSPENASIAQKGINRILTQVKGERAVHFCFGNYGGQTIQSGEWRPLVDFLNGLEADHLVLELAHRPESDLDALAEVDERIKLGLGVIDIKVNHVETSGEVARRIDRAARKLGAGRIGFVHPDCGFWMLHRSITERKLEALVAGRDQYLGR